MSSWVVAAARPRDDTTIDVVPSAGACWHEFVCHVRTKHMQGCGALMWMKWFDYKFLVSKLQHIQPVLNCLRHMHKPTIKYGCDVIGFR